LLSRLLGQAAMASGRLEEGGSIAEDIYSQARQCENLFIRYLEKQRAYEKQVSKCRHRFLTWASFLGVFAKESASLDRRLQSKPEIKELFLSMLRVLKRNLALGKAALNPCHS
jgi:hypothetical protein